MPPYFYSADGMTGIIRAATGVKGLLFPDNDAARAFEAFWVSRDDPSIDAPNDAYADAVKRLSADSDFSEEIDHFSIVCRTGTARTLYVWNVLCRMAFSAFHHRKGVTGCRKVRAIHREIVRYNFAYMCFFFAASPLLEVSFQARTGQGGHHGGLHGPDVQAAHAFLETMDEVPSHAALADAVDRAFAALWRRRKEHGMAVFYAGDGRVARYAERALRLWIVRPMFTSPHAAGLVVRRFFELILAMRGRFLRLVTTGANDQKVPGLHSASVPAILNPLVQIDPVAFAAKRKNWGSLELPGQSERASRQANLLWHILSRSAEVAFMMKANLCKAQIESHLRAQWDFYHPGFIKNRDVCKSAMLIDYAIIDAVMAVRCESPRRLADTSRIASVGLDVFHGIGLKQMAGYEAAGRQDAFAEAFGITYMQV